MIFALSRGQGRSSHGHHMSALNGHRFGREWPENMSVAVSGASPGAFPASGISKDRSPFAYKPKHGATRGYHISKYRRAQTGRVPSFHCHCYVALAAFSARKRPVNNSGGCGRPLDSRIHGAGSAPKHNYDVEMCHSLRISE